MWHCILCKVRGAASVRDGLSDLPHLGGSRVSSYKVYPFSQLPVSVKAVQEGEVWNKHHVHSYAEKLALLGFFSKCVFVLKPIPWSIDTHGVMYYISNLNSFASEYEDLELQTAEKNQCLSDTVCFVSVLLVLTITHHVKVSVCSFSVNKSDLAPKIILH